MKEIWYQVETGTQKGQTKVIGKYDGVEYLYFVKDRDSWVYSW